MNAELKLSDLFFRPDPAVAELPHLITTLDGDLIGKVSHLTKARPGLWPLPAPFDENDQYNEVREQAPFAAWGYGLNQAEVQSVGRLVKDALFGANLILLSSDLDEAQFGPLAQTQGQRLPNGAWFTPGFQDLPTLAPLLEVAGWGLIPLGPGRSRALFITSPRQSEWIGRAQEWCDRQGRDTWNVERAGTECTLVHRKAPEPARSHAIRRHIDAFIGDLELWFGDVDGDLCAKVQQRVGDLRRLREGIARARQHPPATEDPKTSV